MFYKSMIVLLGLVISGCFGAAEVEASPAQSWELSSFVDEMTDEVSHVASLSPVSVEGASGIPASKLFMRVVCSGNLTILAIGWGSYVGERDPRVTYRLDDEPAVSREWFPIDPTSEVTSFPENASKILKQIIDSNTKYFRVRTTPSSGRSVTLTFDVSEMGSALTDIRRGCGW